MSKPRDHGGGLDDAVAQYGGARTDWIDLSTGINPVPYSLGEISTVAWTALPDALAMRRLLAAARQFWNVPASAEIVAAPGLSALIARIPALFTPGTVRIDEPTYNEHRAAFEFHGWRFDRTRPTVRVVVHPNNPTGALWDGSGNADLTIVDESFCDSAPEQSFVSQARGTFIVLKSFGKFWGLAGLRLGFAITQPELAQSLRDLLGPWPVAGPALEIGARALNDITWAEETRKRLKRDAKRLDARLVKAGATVQGGTDLFRLYRVKDAHAWHVRLARARIWSRTFPYSTEWIRLGLPSEQDWPRLDAAMQ